MREYDGGMNPEDAKATKGFSDMLFELSSILNTDDKDMVVDLRKKAPTLERLATYDYGNLSNDIKSGTIPAEEEFMYRAMSLLKRKQHSEYYFDGLKSIAKYFMEVEGNKPDRSVIAVYRGLLLEMAARVALLDPNAQLGKPHERSEPNS